MGPDKTSVSEYTKPHPLIQETEFKLENFLLSILVYTVHSLASFWGYFVGGETQSGNEAPRSLYGWHQLTNRELSNSEHYGSLSNLHPV